MSLVIFFDTETTGLPLFKEPSEYEGQPHIVQIAANLVDTMTRKIVQSMNVIIKPDGWEIPQEVVDIHGITNEHALSVGIPEKQALELFLSLWSGRTRIAHVASFDNRIIRIATKRYCTEEVIDSWAAGESECTAKIAKEIMKMQKQPKLTEAYSFFTGKELQNAHTALADTNACMDVYFSAKDKLQQN